MGRQVRTDITLYYDDRYDVAYANEDPFGDRPDAIDGVNAISAGFVGGYKALIGERIVIEPSIRVVAAAGLTGSNRAFSSHRSPPPQQLYCLYPESCGLWR